MHRRKGLLVNESGLQQQGDAAAWCLGRRPPGSAARLLRRGVYAGGDCLLGRRHFPNSRRVVGLFRQFLLEVSSGSFFSITNWAAA